MGFVFEECRTIEERSLACIITGATNNKYLKELELCGLFFLFYFF